MFDIGFSELLIIAVVALVVLGPERLPKAARFAGLWVRRARAQWYSVKSELERDLAADELRKSMHDTQDAMRGFEDSVRQTGDEFRHELEQVRDTVNKRDLGAPMKPIADTHTDSDTDTGTDTGTDIEADRGTDTDSEHARGAVTGRDGHGA